jgi:hypothetical protein
VTNLRVLSKSWSRFSVVLTRNWSLLEHFERVNKLEKREAALEAAEHLVESMDDMTDALKRVTVRQRVLQAVLAIVAVTLMSVMYFNYTGAVSRCESGNDLRAEIETKFIAMADVLERGGVGESSPEGRELILLLSADIDPRPCSEINWLGR